MNYCVITTINKPNAATDKWKGIFGNNLIIVGDKKTPDDWISQEVNYLPIDKQNESDFVTRYHVPYNHYARKNIGYLTAIKNKATLIYDTDDDNMPNENWKVRAQRVEVNESIGFGWYNPYNAFTNEFIWPRGFSLKKVREYTPIGGHARKESSVQQGLANGDPDVDAIWRLLMKKEIVFIEDRSIYLNHDTWCPFNSQSTWWFPKAYPLMYLPVYSTFRMCDIWRSFVAQRCLWEIGEGVTFHSPAEVFQDRNKHDLLKDFADEVSGYLNNDAIVEILSNLKLKVSEENMCENLLTCYQAIVDKNILPEMEIRSVKAWIEDYGNAVRNI